MSATTESLALRGRIGGLTRWSTEDPVTGTAAARSKGPGQLPYWLNKVDPAGELPDAERHRRAECAKRAHYARLALKSAQARKKAS